MREHAVCVTMHMTGL